MRKNYLMALTVLVLSGSVFAGPINLGDFPIGNWTDANFDAVWEFNSNNIRILSPSGKVYCDFSKKTVNDFKVGISGGGPTISFSSPNTGRDYKFTKSMTDMNITLEIDREGKAHYTSVMKKRD